MSVLILQGPGAHAGTVPCAHHSTQRIRCADIGSLIHSLRAARDADIELVLLDSGAIGREQDRPHWPALRAAIDALPAPYIELHDNTADELQPWLHPQHQPLATVITPGDPARAYAMSVAIATRRLATTSQH